MINGEEGASRTDYQPSEDDNVTVQGVSGSRGGLGYFGFSYFEENQDKLKALEIDDGSGCVAPSVESAQGGDYTPLARPLFVYVKSEALERQEVEDFVRYMLENETTIAERAQFVPLNQTQVDENLAKLDQATGFVTTQQVTAPPIPAVREIDLSPSSRRLGELVVKVILGAGRARLGRDDGRDRDLAALAGDRVLHRDQPLGVPHRDGLVAALRARHLRCASARSLGTFVVTFWALLDRGARRTRHRDLPQRVRERRGRATS